MKESVATILLLGAMMASQPVNAGCFEEACYRALKKLKGEFGFSPHKLECFEEPEASELIVFAWEQKKYCGFVVEGCSPVHFKGCRRRLADLPDN